MDTLASEFKTPEENAVEQSMKDELNAQLLKMDSKSAQVIAMRYGLNGYGERTLKEVGERMNLSRERVRQIEKKALLTLRESNGIDSALHEYITA